MIEINSNLNAYYDYLTKASFDIRRYNLISQKRAVDCSKDEVAEFLYLDQLLSINTYLDIKEILKERDYSAEESESFRLSLKQYIVHNGNIPLKTTYTEDRTWYFTSLYDRNISEELKNKLLKLNQLMSSNSEMLWFKRYFELYYYLLLKSQMPYKNKKFFEDDKTMINWYKDQCKVCLSNDIDANKQLMILNLKVLTNALKHKVGLKTMDSIDAGYELSKIRILLGFSLRAMSKESNISYNRITQTESNDNKIPLDVLLAYQRLIKDENKKPINILRDDLMESYDMIDDIIASKITRLVLKNDL